MALRAGEERLKQQRLKYSKPACKGCKTHWDSQALAGFVDRHGHEHKGCAELYLQAASPLMEQHFCSNHL